MTKIYPEMTSHQTKVSGNQELPWCLLELLLIATYLLYLYMYDFTPNTFGEKPLGYFEPS